MKPFILTLIICAFTAAIASAEAKPKDEASGQDTPTKVAAMANLTGTAWTLKSWSWKLVDPIDIGITAHFIMKDGKSCFYGNDGNDRYTAHYEAKADQGFSVGEIIITESKPSNREPLYNDLLKKVHKHAVDGKKLVLSDKDGKELLVFEKSVEPIVK